MSDERERIAAELAALGEPEPGDDDPAVAFHQAGGAAAHDVDVSTVAMLAGWSDEDGLQTEALSELAQQRVWRTIERRAEPSGAEPAVDSSRPSRRTHGGWLVAGLSLAAGLVLVAVLAPRWGGGASSSPSVEPEEPATVALSAEDLQVMSERASVALQALPGPTGTARVESMAKDYAARLQAASAPGGREG